MLIFSPRNSNLCLESQETRFMWNIFEAVQETRSTCFIGIKTLGYASCFYTPIKHCCSFFKHYFKYYMATVPFENNYKVTIFLYINYTMSINYWLLSQHLIQDMKL